MTAFLSTDGVVASAPRLLRLKQQTGKTQVIHHRLLTVRLFSDVGVRTTGDPRAGGTGQEVLRGKQARAYAVGSPGR